MSAPRTAACIAALASLAAVPARAGDRAQLSDELSGSRTLQAGGQPGLHTFANNLTGTLYLSDAWSLSLGAMVTVEGAQQEAAATPLDAKTGAVVWLSAGADWDLNDSWTVGAFLDVGPKSTRRVPTEIEFSVVTPRGATLSTVTDALLRAQDGTLAGGLQVGYDTGGDSPVEFGFCALATATHLSSDQQLEKVVRRSDGAVLDRSELLALCNAAKKCLASTRAVLRNQEASLDSLKLSLAATATFLRDTDVTFGVDGYLYGEDPTSIGYFRIASSGKTWFSGGAGVPIAPLTLAGRAELLHRFGDFSLRLFGTAGRYASGTAGNSVGAGVKAQYRFNRAWRAWLALTGQWDDDANDQSVRSQQLGLGLAYRF